MVNKGLPNSEMFIEFDNKSVDHEPTLKTGVRYKTSALLAWDSWTAPARTYISSAGEHIDIHAFTEAYLEKILAFHGWLDTVLDEFHASDLTKLRELQETYRKRFGQSSATQSPCPGELADPAVKEPSLEKSLEFTGAVAKLIDDV